MNSKPLAPLVEKYTLLKETEWGTAPELSMGDAEESVIDSNEPESALDWMQAGLYEPETPAQRQLVDAALKDLGRVCSNLQKNLDSWGSRYAKVGANDTVSREQVAQYIAQSILGLKQLD